MSSRVAFGVSITALIGVGAWTLSWLPQRLARPIIPSFEEISWTTPAPRPRLELQESLREPSRAAPAMGETMIEERAAPGSAHLLVALVDADGSPVVEGALEVAWTTHPHVEQSPADESRRVAVQGEITEVFVPPEANGIRIVAKSPGFPPGRAHVYHARRQGDDWYPEDRDVYWDVRIMLSEPVGRVLSGTVLVDGLRRIPDGLRIVLQQDIGQVPDWADTIEEYLGLGPQVAVLDEVTAQYRVWPVQDVAKGLWVVSQETSPRWIPLDAIGLPRASTQDIELSSTGELHLTVLNSRDETPCRHLPLLVERGTVTSRSPRSVSFRSDRLEGLTDDQGRLIVRGLDPEGFIAVTWERTDRRVELLNIRLEDVGDETIERTVHLDAQPATVRAWGILPEAVAERTPLPSIGAFGANGSAEPLLALTEGIRWSMDLPPGSWELKVGTGDLWATQGVPLTVRSGEEVGPIDLVWNVLEPIEIRLNGAPAGSRVQLWAVDEGAGLQQLAGVVAEENPLVLSVAETKKDLHLSVYSPDTRATRQLVLPRTTSRVIEVSLPLREPLSIEPLRNGQPVRGLLSLSLIRLDAPGHEMMVLESTHDGFRARIDPGTYCYILNTLEEGSLWGTTRVPEFSPTLELAWHGRLASATELCPNSTAIEIETLNARDLVALLPREARRLVLPEDGLVWAPDSWTFRCE